MLHRSILGAVNRFPRLSLQTPRACFYSSEASRPLRILFCGSDEFSCASLQALHDEQCRSPESIASIDVLCRPGKPSGRGLRNIREVPVKGLAHSLGLPIHERDTFTGWDLPRPRGEPISLLIAVSFGLFVPPRILYSTQFGGINVHPSMLPDFRGPAPLQHTLLAEDKYTGVTLQTLHPEKFDHGKILAQTPYPGLEIPKAGKCTYSELLEFITPKAAELLVQGIRDRVFDPNRPKRLDIPNTATEGRLERHAPKITSQDRHISFPSMTASTIATRDRALGRLWSIVKFPDDSKRRVVFHDLEAVPRPTQMAEFFGSQDNIEKLFKPLALVRNDEGVDTAPMMKNPDGAGIVVATSGGQALKIGEATVDGKKRMDAAQALFGQKNKDDTKNDDDDDDGGIGYALVDTPVLVMWDMFH